MEMIMMPLVGGIIIGLSASLVLFGLGRITGISGIFATSFLELKKSRENWKYFFIIGLIFGGLLMQILFPKFFEYELVNSSSMTIIAGLLVGFGTRLGSGCTSGHGVCGLPRLSSRSIVATLTFMIAGIITVWLKGVL